ncbi:hypothetical protein O3M35_002317 [Rhynocoris fuscipes]|uniref:DUF4745 domain-containing protein n=1 Tax=Rhynocoris fuscipes TaxID=488301 RepID=A0AAW1CSK6_9HEMI
MKKSPSGINRGKPPSIRTPSYHNTKQRGHLNVDRTTFHLPSLQHTPERLVSMSENPEVQDIRESVSALRFSSKEVSDCMSHWLTFLKVLQTVCTAGAELTDSIASLGCTTMASGCKNRLDHCRAMWDHLAAATNSAVAIVRNQTIASLQEAHIGSDIDQDQLEINQGVVCSGLVRLLNLQYQLGMATCDWVSSSGGSATCTCGGGPSGRELDAVARCFAVRTPTAPIPVEPPQRRWSEAATATHDKTHDPTLRRWSIPWKLALPTTQHHEKSRSTTPDAVWHTTLASQEDLQDVISLLSCRPANANSQHLPGVILTRAEGQNPDNIPKGIMHRGSWWGEAEEADAQSLASRKSSSSTDTTSSCYSLHKSATTSSEELSHGRSGGGGSHLYSMWSGTDLPFIKLPESSEHGDAS